MSNSTLIKDHKGILLPIVSVLFTRALLVAKIDVLFGLEVLLLPLLVLPGLQKFGVRTVPVQTHQLKVLAHLFFGGFHEFHDEILFINKFDGDVGPVELLVRLKEVIEHF